VEKNKHYKEMQKVVKDTKELVEAEDEGSLIGNHSKSRC